MIGTAGLVFYQSAFVLAACVTCTFGLIRFRDDVGATGLAPPLIHIDDRCSCPLCAASMSCRWLLDSSVRPANRWSAVQTLLQYRETREFTFVAGIRGQSGEMRVHHLLQVCYALASVLAPSEPCERLAEDGRRPLLDTHCRSNAMVGRLRTCAGRGSSAANLGDVARGSTGPAVLGQWQQGPQAGGCATMTPQGPGATQPGNL